MEDDIVAKLRAWARGADEQGVAEVFSGLNAAADELERLYKENKQLTAERDEARRSVCECYAAGACDSKMGDWFEDDGRHLLAREEATQRGWDCFEEDGK